MPLVSMSVPSAYLLSVMPIAARLLSAQPSFVTPPPVVSAPAPSPFVIVSPATLPVMLPPCVRPAPVLQSHGAPPSVPKSSVRPLPVTSAPVVEGAELDVPDFMHRQRGSRSHVNASAELWAQQDAYSKQ
ncbi:uncharacterized protein [Procambarus clarkii]|uniref:uncharacterized protein n=1 Tax=Procambarus clarkii TaxID=6728 RepID=UPI003744A6EB